MLRSIEYKLILYTTLLIVSVAAAVYFYIEGPFWQGVVSSFLTLFSLRQLYKHYSKFNSNTLFLLNALESGDYSFHFSETKLSVRERELNQMLNRIKDILSKARREVIENEVFLSRIIESVSTGVIILNQSDGVRMVNHAAKRLLGLPVFTHLKQLYSIDKAFPELFKNLNSNERVQMSISNEREQRVISLSLSELTLKSGKIRIVTLSDIGNELDINEMESWIKLIRVMTHEIMNSIAPITSLSDTMLSAYSDSTELSLNPLERNTIESFETINSTAKGLLAFVDSYRKFTGIPMPVLREFSLEPLLANIIKLESPALLKKRIEVVNQHPSFILNADQGQIAQVLVNLIKNAIQAIDDDDGGKIVIKVDARSDKLRIDICNNGRPIPKDIEPHIFVPFFTTKVSGSGIGLSISRYIMRLHGGNLKHHDVDGWTIFSMVF